MAGAEPRAEDVRLQASPEALCQRVEERAILLHAGTGDYFELDSTGLLIWTRLETGATATELTHLLVLTYDLDPAPARSDVDGFLLELREAGLIEETGS